MLKPQPPAKPSIELLAQAPNMDNNRLEKLVKNFVHEDKARLAAANKNKAMPSSIQYALEKFEKNSTNTSSPQQQQQQQSSPNSNIYLKKPTTTAITTPAATTATITQTTPIKKNLNFSSSIVSFLLLLS